jgi:hypothetical protein
VTEYYDYQEMIEDWIADILSGREGAATDLEEYRVSHQTEVIS